MWTERAFQKGLPSERVEYEPPLRRNGRGGKFTPKSILKKPEEEESQVNLRRDSNPYQYDVVNDFRWTPSNTFFGDLVQIPKYRESLQQYLAAVERKNQREVKNATLEEKPVYRSYVKLGRHSLQAQ